MMMRVSMPIFVVGLVTSVTGCMNMPTPPAEITGSYTSELKYANYDCANLAIELASLARRENELVAAQNERIKTSEEQAFWWGYGQGDGIVAAELATVRGDKDAVRKSMATKRCDQETQVHMTDPVATAQGQR